MSERKTLRNFQTGSEENFVGFPRIRASGLPQKNDQLPFYGLYRTRRGHHTKDTIQP